MSRFERDIVAAGEAGRGALPGDQREAIACYLSAGDGWSEAVKALRGAFAAEAAASADGQDEHEINHRTSEYLQWPAHKNSGTDND